jgi:hypothetical protein
MRKAFEANTKVRPDFAWNYEDNCYFWCDVRTAYEGFCEGYQASTTRYESALREARDALKKAKKTEENIIAFGGTSLLHGTYYSALNAIKNLIGE